MTEVADISVVCRLIGNKANADMMTALLAGPALTPTRLAIECGLTLTATKANLARLEGQRLVVRIRRRGQVVYQLADDGVAQALRALAPLAIRVGQRRVIDDHPVPVLQASNLPVRRSSDSLARACSDHIGGALAVQMFDHFIERRVIERREQVLHLTSYGRAFLTRENVTVDRLPQRPDLMCCACLDADLRRCHLAGSVGAAIFGLFQRKGWALPQRGSRVVRFPQGGAASIKEWFSATP